MCSRIAGYNGSTISPPPSAPAIVKRSLNRTRKKNLPWIGRPEELSVFCMHPHTPTHCSECLCPLTGFVLEDRFCISFLNAAFTKRIRDLIAFATVLSLVRQAVSQSVSPLSLFRYTLSHTIRLVPSRPSPLFVNSRTCEGENGVLLSLSHEDKCSCTALQWFCFVGAKSSRVEKVQRQTVRDISQRMLTKLASLLLQLSLLVQTMFASWLTWSFLCGQTSVAADPVGQGRRPESLARPRASFQPPMTISGQEPLL